MKVSFIGAGNMGGSMVHMLAKSSIATQICVYDNDKDKTELLKKECGIVVADSASMAVKMADIVILAVKPKNVRAVLENINSELDRSKTLVSIAAGVKTATFTQYLGDIHMCRTMPNLPCMVGKGLTGIYFLNMDEPAFDSAKHDIKSIFDCFGKTIILDSEVYIDKMVAVTSSSPAYVCMFIEALADGAVRAGFSRRDAYVMAEQAVAGTAQYLLDTGEHPAVLKDKVCSPAGTTIEAVASLEENGLRNAVLNAMLECERKML